MSRTTWFPQLPDKNTEILQLAAVFRPPDRRQDPRVGKRKSGVRHQKMKQLEFLGCQMNWCPRPFHLAPGRVQLDVTDPDGGGLVRLGRVGAAHDSAQPRRQLADVKD